MEAIHDPAEEPLDLFEECWFYGNMLNRRPKMSRCFSDPCPSSTIAHGGGLGKAGGSSGGLVRTPSLPPCIGRGKETPEKESNYNLSSKSLSRQSSVKLLGSYKSISRTELYNYDVHCNSNKVTNLQTLEKESNYKLNGKAMSRQTSIKILGSHKSAMDPPFVDKNKMSMQAKEGGSDPGKMKARDKSSHQKLVRAPSLPPYIGREEVKETDPPSCRLTRQASHNLSDMLPPRRYSKVLILANLVINIYFLEK